MTQITLRLPDELIRRVDELPGSGERSAKLRALIEKGLEADQAASELAALREVVNRIDENLADHDKKIVSFANRMGRIIPKDANGKWDYLPAARDILEPPK